MYGSEALMRDMAELKDETAVKLQKMETAMQQCYDECDNLRGRLKEEIRLKVRGAVTTVHCRAFYSVGARQSVMFSQAFALASCCACLDLN